MATCRTCGEGLNKSIFAGGRAWKSCPKCSVDTAEDDREHVYYPYPGDFGTTEERASGPNPDGPQSYCIECRGRGSRGGRLLRCDQVQHALAGPGSTRRAPELPADIAAVVAEAELPPEGERRIREHVEIERDRGRRQRVLDLKASRGGLACEGCGKDPADIYGPGYTNVLEVHHKIPLARGVQQAELTDFAVLCPTCHRVVHYGTYEPLSIQELRTLLGRS